MVGMTQAKTSSVWLAVCTVAITAALITLGKSRPEPVLGNEGKLAPNRSRPPTKRSLPVVLGSIAKNLPPNESIVSVLSAEDTPGDDGEHEYKITVMLFDSNSKSQTLEHLVASSTASGTSIRERTTVTPVPAKNNETAFVPSQSPSMSDAYPRSSPVSFEYAEHKTVAPDTLDFSVLDRVQAPAMQDLYNSIATDKSSFKLQYG